MSRINLEEIAVRNEAARHRIAGFSADMPALAEFWRNLDTALTDNLALSAEVTRLSTELTATRLDIANLLAAGPRHPRGLCRRRGDPLWYVRDELHAHQVPSQGNGRAS